MYVTVTVAVPEGRVAEFYAHHGAWLARPPQHVHEPQMVNPHARPCVRCKTPHTRTHGAVYCSPACMRADQRDRRRAARR